MRINNADGGRFAVDRCLIRANRACRYHAEKFMTIDAVCRIMHRIICAGSR